MRRITLDRLRQIRNNGVPDGPPVRRSTCDRDCDTRWDREPRHSERCEREHERLGREINARIEASQREVDAEIRAYVDYRARLHDAP